MDGLYGVLGGLVFWGFILAVCILPLMFRYRERKELHETMRAYLAKGEDIPEELMSTLRRGVEDEAQRMTNARGMETGGFVLISLAIGAAGFGAILVLVMWGRGDLRDGLTAGPIIAGGGFVLGVLGVGLRIAGQTLMRRIDEARRV
ncbi:MAG: hypothetical protein JWM33_2639 [Caulobacteraceae bacterium]|nr:hypothetical protein [Caulobacteraceae bacterium]